MVAEINKMPQKAFSHFLHEGLTKIEVDFLQFARITQIIFILIFFQFLSPHFEILES